MRKFNVRDRVIFIPRGDIIANPIASRPPDSHGTVVKCIEENGWVAYDVQLDGAKLQMLGERVLVAEPVVATEETTTPTPVAKVQQAETKQHGKPRKSEWEWHNPVKDKEQLEKQWNAITADHFDGTLTTYAQALPKKEKHNDRTGNRSSL